jgi:putative peptidoglycan lipid II flippase
VSGLLRANVAVAGGTFLSRLTGLLRITVLSGVLGLEALTDAYNAANNTPNIIYELVIGGVLTATLVPFFVRAFEDDDDESVSAVITVAVCALVVLTVVATLAAPVIIGLYGAPGGVDGEQFQSQATTLARLFLPQILFYGLTALATALLNARRRFAAPAWVPVLNNMVVIAVLLALPSMTDEPLTLDGALADPTITLLLGLGTTAGIVAMTVALLPSLRSSGVKIHWRFDWRHPAVKRLVRLSGWTVGYVASNQIAAFVIIKLALGEGEGWQSAYTFAFTFFQLPHGLLAVSLMTTFGPDLASAARREDWQAFRNRMGYGLRLLVTFVLPAAAGYVVLADPVVGGLLQRGEFDPEDAVRTAEVLVPFAIGLPFFSAYLFVLRGFYALQDTRTPFVVNAVENGLNIVFAVALIRAGLGAPGLAAAYSMAYAFSAVVALGLLSSRVGGFALGKLARRLAPPVAAAVVMAVAVAFVSGLVGADTGIGAWVRLGVGVIVGMVVYGGLLVLNGAREAARKASVGSTA